MRNSDDGRHGCFLFDIGIAVSSRENELAINHDPER